MLLHQLCADRVCFACAPDLYAIFSDLSKYYFVITHSRAVLRSLFSTNLINHNKLDVLNHALWMVAVTV